MVNLLNFQMDGLDYFVPSESQMNLVALITSGLLDRYPDLQIVHAEQGAKSIKPLAERLDALHGPIVAAYEQGESATKGSRRKLSPRAPQLVEKELRDTAERVSAVYHSHVGAGAYLSEMDLEYAEHAFFPFPDAHQIVIEVYGNEDAVGRIGIFRRDGVGRPFQGCLVRPVDR